MNNRERQLYLDQRNAAILELKYALAQRGWISPHSFILRNPEPKQERLALWEACATTQFTPNVNMGFIYSHTKEEVANARRVRYYRGVSSAVSDLYKTNGETLETLLSFAITKGFTEVEQVRTHFTDIEHMLGMYRSEYRAQIELRLGVEKLIDTAPLPDEIIILTQGAHHHTAITTGKRVIQYEDDPELVHVADAYLLYMLYIQNHPDYGMASQYRYAQEIHDLTADDLPDTHDAYRVPPWFNRMVKNLEAGEGWIPETFSRDQNTYEYAVSQELRKEAERRRDAH